MYEDFDNEIAMTVSSCYCTTNTICRSCEKGQY